MSEFSIYYGNLSLLKSTVEDNENWLFVLKIVQESVFWPLSPTGEKSEEKDEAPCSYEFMCAIASVTSMPLKET
jgi:hypothetical protein